MEVHYHRQRRVEFAETDMAGITHFTNFCKYMEEAEHAFLRSRGLSVVLEDNRGKLGFPKVSVSCDFLQTARYEDVIDIQVRVRCDDGKSITYDCDFQRAGNRIATGQLRVACCRFPVDRPPFAIPISEELLHQLFTPQPGPTDA